MNPTTSLCILAALAATAVSQDTGIQLTNGIDGALELPHTPQMAPQSGLTVEAWITYDDATIPIGQGARYPTIARQHFSGGGLESWFLRVNAGGSGTTQLRFRGSTTGGNIIVNWNFTPGQLLPWTHVAATFDQNLVAIYINGAMVASLPGNGMPLVDFLGDLRVGKGATLVGGAANEVWNGEIDELRIWPFARTAAEIAASMNEKLYSVPGLVATWNFDNTLTDSSSGLTLVQSGQVAFNPNTLQLLPNVPGTAIGASTPGCLGDLLISPVTSPVSGNAAFGAACVQLPPNAFAFWGIAFATLPSAFTIAGIDYWLDPSSSVSFFTGADAFGVLRFALPIPASGFGGVTMGLQAAAIDPCGPQGFTASNAMSFTIQ